MEKRTDLSPGADFTGNAALGAVCAGLFALLESRMMLFAEWDNTDRVRQLAAFVAARTAKPEPVNRNDLTAWINALKNLSQETLADVSPVVAALRACLPLAEPVKGREAASASAETA